MSSSFWQDLESHMLLGYNASIVNLAELVHMFNLYCRSCRAMTSVNRYRENPSNDLMLFTSGTATSLCWHGQYSAGRCHQRCYMLASRWLILCKTPSSCPASISFYTPPMYSLDSSPCLPMSPVSLPLVWVLRPALEPHWTKTQHGFGDEEVQVQHVQWFSFVFMKCKLFCDVFPHWMSSMYCHLLVNYTTKGFHIAVFAVNVNEPYSVSVLDS